MSCLDLATFRSWLICQRTCHQQEDETVNKRECVSRGVDSEESEEAAEVTYVRKLVDRNHVQSCGKVLVP